MISFIGRHLSLLLKKMEASAQKRQISLKIWFPLWIVGSAIWYWGLWVLVARDFFLGLAMMAGSYFLDYGYVFVAGKPDRKMLILISVYGAVSVVSLTQRIGFGYAALVVTIVGGVIAIARAFHNRGKE